MTTTRRRFLTIAAAAAVVAGRPAAAAPLHRWRGQALGAQASIILAHPQAERITAMALAEIARLEEIFSLYRPHSAISRLNATGLLQAPPFELLECLGLAGAVHSATGGLFDPTVQPLWAAWASAQAHGGAPDAAALATARAAIGWGRVRLDAAAITLDPGMALTLNGIAQGYVADRIADLLAGEGLTDVLIDTGEMRALGGHPDGGAWDVGLRAGDALLPRRVELRDRALASSAPLGTVFDAGGQLGHILDPRTAEPAPERWSLVSVAAPRAALADALSTAFCLMERPAISAALARFPQAELVALV
ncbi:FAD:protein FMN transferase [Phaeovulum sp. NW3]|uniref:FAD:protein FMN transferase n=1 Tax=Phaeovulum sp. NW3 TaxID=2934933 RepID=UPI00202259A2|nr:FAD:protein FMN transferase [Phaeovulum sp. NW3]MCL7464685.1 FAD:protein FMN transferase [Phaeovulum sp. NW3]